MSEEVTGASAFMPNAWSRADVRMVAQQIRALPDNATPAFAARLLTDGLMLSRQWGVRFAHRILLWRGLSPFDAWAHLMSRDWRDGGMPHATRHALDFREQAAAWCEAGKDASSVCSAGGFNQSELNRVVHCVRCLAARDAALATPPAAAEAGRDAL